MKILTIDDTGNTNDIPIRKRERLPKRRWTKARSDGGILDVGTRLPKHYRTGDLLPILYGRRKSLSQYELRLEDIPELDAHPRKWHKRTRLKRLLDLRLIKLIRGSVT